MFLFINEVVALIICIIHIPLYHDCQGTLQMFATLEFEMPFAKGHLSLSHKWYVYLLGTERTPGKK